MGKTAPPTTTTTTTQSVRGLKLSRTTPTPFSPGRFVRARTPQREVVPLDYFFVFFLFFYRPLAVKNNIARRRHNRGLITII